MVLSLQTWQLKVLTSTSRSTTGQIEMTGFAHRVRSENLIPIEIIINKIVNILNKTNIEENRKIFDTINPIYTASVPVIKLVNLILQKY